MVAKILRQSVEIYVALLTIAITSLFPSYMRGEFILPVEFLVTFWFIPVFSFVGYVVALWILKYFIKSDFWRHLIALSLGYWFFLWSLLALAIGNFSIWG